MTMNTHRRLRRWAASSRLPSEADPPHRFASAPEGALIRVGTAWRRLTANTSNQDQIGAVNHLGFARITEQSLDLC